MSIIKKECRGCVVIRLCGRVTVAEADKMAAVVSETLRHGVYNIVFSFEQAEYVASAIIRHLFHAHKECAKVGRRGHICLACVSGHPYKTLEMIGLLEVTIAFDSEEKAIESFGAAPVPAGH